MVHELVRYMKCGKRFIKINFFNEFGKTVCVSRPMLLKAECLLREGLKWRHRNMCHMSAVHTGYYIKPNTLLSN